MSARERNRYVTAATAFLIAFGILALLLVRSVWVTAQILDFTWRPQAATTNTYVGGNPTDCESDATISATQRLGFAFDQNLTTAATTYTDADIFGDGLQTPDTGFTESAKWSSFQQTTVFIEDTDLLVRIAGKNNSTTARQWKIEYSVDGPVSGPWHEMVRFTIGYNDHAGEADLTAGDEILLFMGGDTTQPYDDVGYMVTKDTGADQLVLERYYSGSFESWDVNDAIENLGVGGNPPTFSTTISTASSIDDENPGDPDADPPSVIVLGEVLGNDDTRSFLTDDDGDPNYILNDLSDSLAVRIQTSQQGCNTAGDTCPLCGGDPADLAILNIYDIQVETTWNTDTGGDTPLVIATESLPDGVKGEAYDELVQAAGGIMTYSWDILSGNLGLCPPDTAGDICADDAYGSAPDFRIYGTSPLPATYTFTLKVSDSSVPPQTAQKQFTFTIAGVAIYPEDPILTATVEPPAFDQDFAPCDPVTPCGTSPYDWCLVSSDDLPNLTWTPSVPDCSSSTVQSTNINLSGQPDNAGTYRFKLRLTDANEETAEKEYTLEVGTTHVRILPPTLKPMVKGVQYRNNPSVAATYQRMEAPSLTAVRVSTGSPSWTPSTALTDIGLNLLDKTVDTAASISRTYVAGEIDITEQSGDYSFTATITDGSYGNTLTIPLKVLERKTLLLKAPPSSVQLPDDHMLKFVVFAEGGAPSTATGTTPDGSKAPYYNYDWSVTPVNSDSPALDTESGTTSPNKAEPDTITITFEDTNNIPVSGIYDVRLWARDVLTRNPPTGDDYTFVPATVRLKVNAPPELEKRPIKLRQEQF